VPGKGLTSLPPPLAIGRIALDTVLHSISNEMLSKPCHRHACGVTPPLHMERGLGVR
jgi:hypothetical protein